MNPHLYYPLIICAAIAGAMDAGKVALVVQCALGGIFAGGSVLVGCYAAYRLLVKLHLI